MDIPFVADSREMQSRFVVGNFFAVLSLFSNACSQHRAHATLDPHKLQKERYYMGLQGESTRTAEEVTQDVAVRLTDVRKSFGSLELLSGVSLEVREGERLALLGPGGCGKSTLLKIMLGLVPPDGGTVEIFGKKIFELDRQGRSEVLRQIGMAFQQGALFDFMTVRENIIFAMENMTKLSLIEMEERVVSMLESVALPSASRKIPSELSGGMRRRVGIVRALATNPRLAFLDEPTAGLDPVTTNIVIEMIHRLADKIDSTLVCVTSSVEVAFTFAQRVAILKDGRIIGQGTWAELHALGDPWILNFLDVRNFKPAAPLPAAVLAAVP